VPAERREPDLAYALTNLRYARGPALCGIGTVGIDEKGKIRLQGHSSFPATNPEFDLDGYLALPGLVNAHDHLQYALHPRLGNGRYANYVEWGKDIHSTMADVIERYNAIDRNVRLWWGGIRNLLCGVTTVCHHDKLWPALQNSNFPVRVLLRYGWSHSAGLDPNVKSAHTLTEGDAPFFIHAGEGIDPQSLAEFQTLNDLEVLDHKTVIVHGLALDEETSRWLGKRGVSLVLCPSSNQFLYGRVPSTETARHFSKVALGSDSPISAMGDLLDEIAFAGETLGLTPERLYAFVGENAASVLRLSDGEGTIRDGGVADLMVVRDSGATPARRLSDLRWQDVEMVIVAGRVQLASVGIWSRMDHTFRSGLEPLEIDGVVRWLRAPVLSLWENAFAKLTPDGVRLGTRVLRNPAETASSNQVAGQVSERQCG
jgi:cytosine/adenosine deaminase-related metal-dependent hydrolase